MDAAMLCPAEAPCPNTAMKDVSEGHLVDAAEFRRLLVSHRRMVRVDRRADRLRGLQDLDTGEIFLVEERRLLERQR
jgi:hypothetical protein